MSDDPSKSSLMQDEGITYKDFYNTSQIEAGGLYQQILTVATAMFGGTVIFLEKITATPTKLSLLFLGGGWFFLVATIAFCLIIRLLNIKACEYALEDNTENCKIVTNWNRRLTTVTIVSLCLGMIGIGVFGFLSLWARNGTQLASVGTSSVVTPSNGPATLGRNGKNSLISCPTATLNIKSTSATPSQTTLGGNLGGSHPAPLQTPSISPAVTSNKNNKRNSHAP
jgi:hypothetical protein